MRVGIVDYETGRHNLTRRLYMLRAGDCEQLGAVSMPKGERPNDDEFWCKLEEEKLDLAIIDSLRMANPGANENDSAEAILPLDAAGRFAELTGCAVLFIHHANKSSGDGWPDMRGSGAINDQLDYAFAVRKLDVSNEDKRVEVKCTKPGDMRAPDPFTVQVLFDDAAKRATVALAPDDGAGVNEGGGGAGPTQDTDTTAQIQQRVKLLLASGPIETKSLIREKVTGNRSRVLAAIEALEVREEIAFLKGVGYVLDSEDARTERVLEQAERHARWKSPAELAKASDVQTPFVERLVKDGVLTPRLSGPSPGGYLVDRSKVRLFGG